MTSRAGRIAAMFRVEHDAAVISAPEDPWKAAQEAKKELRAAKRAERRKTKAKRSRAAAKKLEAGGVGELDVALLLDELTVDDKVKQLSFMVTDGEDGRYFNFERMRLRSIGTERRRNSRMKDLRAWIDTKGIHLRWGDHGGMDLQGTGGRAAKESKTICMTFLTGKTVETAA